MERLLQALFLVTGILPLVLGSFLLYRDDDYYVAAVCFIISVCAFQQIYHFLKSIDQLKKQIADQQARLEEHNQDRKQLTRNLADMFSFKMQEQERKFEDQRNRLAQANKIIEQKNKEIWALNNDYDNY